MECGFILDFQNKNYLADFECMRVYSQKKREGKKNAAEFDCSLISVSEIEQQSWTSFLYPSPLRIIRADRELLNAYETD